MPTTNADVEIEKLYGNIENVQGQQQAKATLLLAMKVGDLETSLIAVKSAVDGVQQSLGIVLDHDRGAIRTTDEPKKP